MKNIRTSVDATHAFPTTYWLDVAITTQADLGAHTWRRAGTRFCLSGAFFRGTRFTLLESRHPCLLTQLDAKCSLVITGYNPWSKTYPWTLAKLAQRSDHFLVPVDASHGASRCFPPIGYNWPFEALLCLLCRWHIDTGSIVQPVGNVAAATALTELPNASKYVQGGTKGSVYV